MGQTSSQASITLLLQFDLFNIVFYKLVIHCDTLAKYLSANILARESQAKSKTPMPKITS